MTIKQAIFKICQIIPNKHISAEQELVWEASPALWFPPGVRLPIIKDDLRRTPYNKFIYIKWLFWALLDYF